MSHRCCAVRFRSPSLEPKQLTFSGPNSAGPGSVGPTSAGCSGEPLTPDNVVSGEAAAQAGTTTSSLLAEQVVDGVIPDDEPGTLPQVIVLYLVSTKPFVRASEKPLNFWRRVYPGKDESCFRNNCV